MRLKFWKMTAAGNDFVLVAGARARSLPRLARRFCDRRAGVGADGLLAVARVRGGVGLRYFNADGSAAFCGNGARCAAWWAFRQGWTGRALSLVTSQGTLAARIVGREQVALAMPEPRRVRMGQKLLVRGRVFRVHFLDTGAPHAVVEVRGLESFPVSAWGRAIRRHRMFGPGGTNVDFAAWGRGGLRLRTYERGVEAETWACGTGAVAAAVAGYRLGRSRPPVSVRARGGELAVRFKPQGEGVRDIWLKGPARTVFQGEVKL